MPRLLLALTFLLDLGKRGLGDGGDHGQSVLETVEGRLFTFIIAVLEWHLNIQRYVF